MSRDSNKASAGKPPSDSNDSLGRIRNYDLLAKIGQGGMGTVYLASHTMLKRKAALKLLPQERMAPPPISESRDDVPAEVAAALERMLAKDPADRFATPQQVADALQPFAAGADLAKLANSRRPKN